MDDNQVTIERVISSSEPEMTLYRLSNGDIINEDEAINYVRQGKLSGAELRAVKRGRII